MLEINVNKRQGQFSLNVEMQVGDEVLVILGPSGAGKSTLLNLVAGLATPDGGLIRFRGRDFFRRVTGQPSLNLPVHQRGLGYVFQKPSLFPHLNVWENVAYGADFPLQRRREDPRAAELLRLLRLEGLEERRPVELSGGQEQRVALARALYRRPRLLLMDEPFAALDNHIRSQLRLDLLHIRRQLEVPMILVTHDLEEAFTLSERVAVMNQGQVLQMGAPDEVFYHPATREVACFLGMKNVWDGQVAGRQQGQAQVDLGWATLTTNDWGTPVGQSVTVGIRPEDVMLIRQGRELGTAVKENCLLARVVSLMPEVHGVRVLLAAGVIKNSYNVEMWLPRHVYQRQPLEPGLQLTISLKQSGLVLLGN